MTSPFVWGNNGPASPEQIDAERKVAEALMSTNPNPQTMWQGIEAASGRIGGSLLNWKAGSDQKAGQEDYTRQLAALGENPSRSALETVAGNGFANPGQDAVVRALLAQNLQQSDPNQQLDRELKQAQLDAANAKPAQPLMTVNGEIYDPNNKTWIAPPSNDRGGSGGVVPLGENGQADPAAQDAFLKSFADPQYANIVKKVANYELDPTKITSLRGGTAATDSQRLQLIKDAAAYDPTFDGTQFGVRAATKKAYTIGTQGQTITSANTVIGHLSDLADRVAKLNNSDFVPFNQIGNLARQTTSNPDLALMMTDRQAVASELAKFFKGTGATDLTTTQEWLQRLDPSMGGNAMQSVIQDIVGNLMKSRLDEMKSQYQAAVGKPYDFAFISPKTASVLKKMNINLSDIGNVQGGNSGTQWAPKILSKDSAQADKDYEALPSAAHFIGPDGVQRVKP